MERKSAQPLAGTTPRQQRTNMPKAEFPVASLPAPGRMHVDWEERVDFRRLHEYRLSRAREAIANAGLGAVLVFDMNLSLIHISEPTRLGMISYAVFCLKK